MITIISSSALIRSQYRGYVQYYILAHNLMTLKKLHWIMLMSLLKTLAHKHQVSVKEIAKRYKTVIETPDGPRRCFEVKVEREGKKPLIARFGGILLKQQKWAEIDDGIFCSKTATTEVVQRLLANTCEICGSTRNVEVHHIRRLADLNAKGRKQKPQWMKIMAGRRRKTLVVCKACHVEIHAGKIDTPLPLTG